MAKQKILTKKELKVMNNYGFKKLCPTCTKVNPNVIRFSKTMCQLCISKESRKLIKQIKINNQ